jgi:hypothetical protein
VRDARAYPPEITSRPLVVVQVVAGSSPVAHPKHLQIRHHEGTDPGKLSLLPSRSRG